MYYRIDSVLIFEIKGAHEAGIYGAAYRFLDPIQFVPVSVLAAVFPVMAAVHDQDPERVRRLVQRAGDYLLIAAAGVLGGTVALSAPIVDLLLGPEYEASATVLPILMFAFVFISLGYLSGYLTTIVGKRWLLVGFAAGGACLEHRLEHNPDPAVRRGGIRLGNGLHRGGRQRTRPLGGVQGPALPACGGPGRPDGGRRGPDDRGGCYWPRRSDWSRGCWSRHRLTSVP